MIKVKFLRDINNAEASYEVAVNVKHIFEVRISQTAKTSGPSSPEYRIREKVRERLLNGTLHKHGEVVLIGFEIDPRFF